MVTITLYARQQKRHRCIEQSFGLCGRGKAPGSRPRFLAAAEPEVDITVQFSYSVVSNSATHGLQYTRPPCLSATPGVYSNSCPLSQ